LNEEKKSKDKHAQQAVPKWWEESGGDEARDLRCPARAQ